METILKIKDLFVIYDLNNKEIVAVNNISFHLNRNEILALAGESGSGKSTTALSILNLIEPPGCIKNGSIEYDNINILSLSEKQLNSIRGEKISMIFQEPSSSLDPLFTIGQQLTETLQYHKKYSYKEARELSIEWLNRVGFKEPNKIFDSYPFELSGGMQQRAMIAIALCCYPSILLADEPTSSLDVISQAQIIDLLIKMKEEFKLSILLITHNFGLISNSSERIAIMYKGRILEEGTTDEIFQNPLHPYTISLLKSIPSLNYNPFGRNDIVIQQLFSENDFIQEACPFYFACPIKIKDCMLEFPPSVSITSTHIVYCWKHQ